MSGDDPRGGRQARVRRYEWRDRGVSIPGATIEVRRGMERRSVFIPVDQLVKVADGLVDALEAIEAEGGTDAHSAA